MPSAIWLRSDEAQPGVPGPGGESFIQLGLHVRLVPELVRPVLDAVGNSSKNDFCYARET